MNCSQRIFALYEAVFMIVLLTNVGIAQETVNTPFRKIRCNILKTI